MLQHRILKVQTSNLEERPVPTGSQSRSRSRDSSRCHGGDGRSFMMARHISDEASGQSRQTREECIWPEDRPYQSARWIHAPLFMSGARKQASLTVLYRPFYVIGCAGIGAEFFGVVAHKLPIHGTVWVAELKQCNIDMRKQWHGRHIQIKAFYTLKEMRDTWLRLPDKLNSRCDIVTTGSPCQPFSTMREHTKGFIPAHEHPLWATTFGGADTPNSSALEMLVIFKPKFAMLKNVC